MAHFRLRPSLGLAAAAPRLLVSVRGLIAAWNVAKHETSDKPIFRIDMVQGKRVARFFHPADSFR
jgi:hypothetical protein